MKDEWVPANTQHIAYFKTVPERSDYEEAMSIIYYFRKDLECTSYCYEHIFGWDFPIEDGRPAGVCRDELKHEVYLVFKYPAVVALVAAIVSGVALPTQYLLWKSYQHQGKKKKKTS